MMSYENRKAVVQLVRDLAAKGLSVHFQLQMLSGYADKKFRRRAYLRVSYLGGVGYFGYSFVSRNYKTNEDGGVSYTSFNVTYASSKVKHGLFDEREAKSLLNDLIGTLKSSNKIGRSVRSVKHLFDMISDVFVSKENLILKAEISGITDKEAENFGVNEDICL